MAAFNNEYTTIANRMKEENTQLRKEVKKLNEIITHLLDKIKRLEQQIEAYATGADGVQVLPGYIIAKDKGRKDIYDHFSAMNGETNNVYHHFPASNEETKNANANISESNKEINVGYPNIPAVNEEIKNVRHEFPASNEETKNVWDDIPATSDVTKNVRDHIPASGNGSKNVYLFIPSSRNEIHNSNEENNQQAYGAKTIVDRRKFAGDTEEKPSEETTKTNKPAKEALENNKHTNRQASATQTGNAAANKPPAINQAVLEGKLLRMMKHATLQSVDNTACILLALHTAPATSLKSLRAHTDLSEKGMIKRMTAMKKAGLIVRIGPPKQYLLTSYGQQLVEESVVGG